MFWEEKIDKLRKETDPEDFKVPFTTWAAVLKKIEDKFIVKKDSNYHFSNWQDRIKDKITIKRILTSDLNVELDNLDTSQNYWIILTRKKADFRNMIYDSKLIVVKKLVDLWDGDFYILDKKYNWLAFFEVSRLDTEVYKSGKSKTPFEKGNCPP